MATNIFSPLSGRTYSYGGFSVPQQQTSNIFNGVNPYYINNTNTYTPPTPVEQVLPTPTVDYSGGDSGIIGDPMGDGLSFGYGYSNTSPGYSGPYSNNPLDSERSFMDRLSEAASNYMNNYSILGIAANALNPYDPTAYAKAVGVAEPVTFSTKTAQDYINEAAAANSGNAFGTDTGTYGGSEAGGWGDSAYTGGGGFGTAEGLGGQSNSLSDDMADSSDYGY